MTKLLGWVAATTIGAAIVTATPAGAFQGGGFEGGMHGSGMHFAGGGFGGTGGMQMGRKVSVGGPFYYNYVPYYYDYVPYDGNYCWQQVWTRSGWQWVDACSGYYGYGY